MAEAVLQALKPNELRIVPLGGCGEFGMNLTAYIHQGRVFVVDAGIMFPEPERLGIDAIVPKVAPWFDELGGVTAYLITHGHEDHIGALPHLIERWPAPIYATPWTAGLIRSKFSRRGFDERFPVTSITPGDHLRTSGFDVEWVHINHSIPMACSLVIRTSAGTVFHTGDFKLDFTPIGEAAVDMAYLFQLGEQGVDMLLVDSTNAHQPGFCPSERSVVGPLESLLRGAHGASVITTFASNLWRLQTIVDLAQKLGKTLLVAGNGIHATLGLAESLGLHEAAPHVYPIDEAAEVLATNPRQNIIVLATGSQGEAGSALSRIAAGEHKAFRFEPGDQLIFSSRIIPGNEKAVLHISNLARKAGAHVVSSRRHPEIHVSGHGFQGDVQLLLTALRPRYVMPVHGTFTHLEANVELAQHAGIEPSHVLMVEDGDVVSLDHKEAAIIGTIDVDVDYVDSESLIPIPYDVLRERLQIGRLGVAVVAGAVSASTRAWLAPPRIELRGLLFAPETNVDAFMTELKDDLVKKIGSELAAGVSDEAAINETARLTVRRNLNRILHKKPVVMAQILLI